MLMRADGSAMNGNTASLDQIFLEAEATGKGVAIFIFQVPRAPQAHDFPIPEVPPSLDGFMKWSDYPGQVNPRKFEQAHHIYAMVKAKVIVFGVIGPENETYTWAQKWLDDVSKQERYFQWTKETVWLTADDFLQIGQPQITEVDINPMTGDVFFNKNDHVDLDDPNVVSKIFDATAEQIEAEKDFGIEFPDDASLAEAVAREAADGD